jgi:hypothetical protein
MISKKTLIIILLLPILFILSYEITSAYIHGDQGKPFGYRDLYRMLRETNFKEVGAVAYKHVNSKEPISYYILWIGAISGLDKDLFISLLNVVLLVGFILLGFKYRVSNLVIFLLLTNYYTIALLGAAERLKIAYIFLVYSALFTGKKTFFMLALSPFAHLQSIILFPSLLMGNYSGSIRNQLVKISKGLIVIRVNLFLKYAVASIFILAVLILQLDSVLLKASSYISYDFSPKTVFKLTAFSLILLIVTKNNFRMILVLLPLFPATLLLGDSRVNMITFTLAFYYLMREERLNHPLILMVLLYFSIKSIDFLYRIFAYGNGYIDFN